MLLKVLTLKYGCFDQCSDKVNNNYVNFINSVGTFFKLLKENCPNLSKLNLGTQFQSRSVDTIYKNLFSMAGLEMLKELNVDFTFFNGGDGNRDGKSNLEWFLGLINDCNNIETLSLNGLMFPYCLSGDMKAMKEKFKNLKNCEISFEEGFEKYFEHNPWGNSSYDGYTGVVLHTAEIVKDLDETFADRKTEFKVLIPAYKYQDGYIEDVKCFQIIKMPFENSVITTLDS